MVSSSSGARVDRWSVSILGDGAIVPHPLHAVPKSALRTGDDHPLHPGAVAGADPVTRNAECDHTARHHAFQSLTRHDSLHSAGRNDSSD
jgi:hypothetical protein